MRFPDALLGQLSPVQRATLQARLEHAWGPLWAQLDSLYACRQEWSDAATALCRVVAARVGERSTALTGLDLRRERAPDWFLEPSVIGYSAYVDRFATDLRGVVGRLDYLQELGVRYLHLLPLYEAEPERSDGGFAVANHLRVSPHLGTNDDLVALTGALRARGMSLCLDFVLNHTARAHRWAAAARAGDSHYRGYYHVFDDRSGPDAFEATLEDVFPVTAPGNFTEVEGLGWVWTTFYPFQWDLDWSNPHVFVEMVDVMLGLANCGVEALRVDSAAFIWKRAGTDCRNQPEVHQILQCLRTLAGLVAPSLVLKAEAIVPSRYLAKYFGTPERPECQLAYHSTLMAGSWLALATGRGDRLCRIAQALPQPPTGAAWVTYLRCHDDIGWPALQPELGDDATATLAGVSAFFAGTDGYARGQLFQAQSGGVHGTNGMLASLIGLEAADGGSGLVDQAVRRLTMLHGLWLATGGLPLIYMGDELGQTNDWNGQAEQVDGRWLHRPRFDEGAAARRHDPSSVSGRVWAMVRHLIARRASLPALHGSVPTEFVATEEPGLVAIRRPHPTHSLLVLVNVTEHVIRLPTALTPPAGWADAFDVLTDAPFQSLALQPYQVVWLQGVA